MNFNFKAICFFLLFGALFLGTVQASSSSSASLEESALQASSSSSASSSVPLEESVLQDLQDHISLYKNHLEDFLDITTQKNAEIEAVDRHIFAFPEHITQNIITANVLSSLLSLVSSNPDSLEDVLKKFLMVRFDYIQQRKKNTILFRQSIYSDSPGCILYGPTKPRVMEGLRENNRLHAEMATNVYQTMNRCILGLLSLSHMPSLEPEIKKMIQASVTLHARITGDDDDLGHPDEAVLTYDDDVLKTKDITFYENYFCKQEFITRRTKKRLFMTPAQYFSGPGSMQKITPLPDPDFLKTKAQLASQEQKRRAREASRGSESFLPDHILRELSRKKKQPVHKSRKKRSGRRTKASHSRVVQRQKQILDEKQIKEDEGPLEGLEDVAVATEEERAGDDLLEKKPVKSDSSEVLKDLKPDLEVQPEGEVLDQDQKVIEESSDHAFEELCSSSSSSSSAVSVEEDIGEDREEVVPFMEEGIKITGKHSRTLSNIFDPRAFSRVNYKKFSALWQHIGGEIEGSKSGGSHRVLIWKGQKIMGTFVPHGGQGYGKRVIKTLRSALIKAGYGEF